MFCKGEEGFEAIRGILRPQRGFCEGEGVVGGCKGCFARVRG